MDLGFDSLSIWAQEAVPSISRATGPPATYKPPKVLEDLGDGSRTKRFHVWQHNFIIYRGTGEDFLDWQTASVSE